MTPGDVNVIMNSSVLNFSSSNSEDFPSEETSDLDLVIVIFTSLILGLMILTTVIGKARLFIINEISENTIFVT